MTMVLFYKISLNILFIWKLEENGFCDDDGEVQLKTKVIKSEKKNFNEENAKRAAFKNANKRRSMHTYLKSRNTDTPKNTRNVNHVQKAPMMDFNRNIDSTQQSFINQCVADDCYNSDDNYCNDCHGCNFKLFDDFKYSMRSDESLSDFSKSSDSDDYKNACYPNSAVPNYNLSDSSALPYDNNTPAYLHPSNCSFVKYPFQLPHNQQPVNLQRQNPNNFFNTQIPWSKLGNLKDNSMPVQMPLEQPNIFDYLVSAAGNNGFKNVENVRYHEVMRNGRPILNRNYVSAS